MSFNPWALLLILVGAAVIVVGFKGNQDNFIAALKGTSYNKSTLK